MASRMERERILRFKSYEISLARAGYTQAGHALSQEDNERVANAMVLWGLITLDLGISWCETRQLSEANIARWLCWLRTFDIDYVLEALKTVLASLRAECQHTHFNVRRFKRTCPSNCRDIVGPFRVILYRTLETDSVEAFSACNTFLQFWTRLTLHDLTWVEDDAIQKYVAFEQQLKDQRYDDGLIEELRASVNDLFGDCKLTELPRFSNGATAEVRRGGGVGKKMLSPLTWGCRQFLLHHYGDIGQAAFASSPLSRSVCKYQLVPKGVNKKRGISMEPAWNQYCQQAIFQSVDRYCNTHPLTRVHLHDQSLNRSLALEGSSTLQYATIDMSDASDSVSLTLVKRVCRDLPIYGDLIRTRTRYVEVPHRGTLLMEKFAPMGSACCFPIECIVFSAIVHIVEMRTGRRLKYLVYGDDIVVPSWAYEQVVDLLWAFGFTVNLDKSFVYSRFTESCGIEAFDGFDVSPIRLSRRYDVPKLRKRNSVQQYLGAVDLINRLYGTCFILTRKYLITDLLRYYPESYFCHPGEEYGIISNCTDLNYHLEVRYNERLQRVEHRCVMGKTIERSCSDALRYSLLLERYQYCDRPCLNELTLIQVKAGPTTTALRKRWYPGWLSPVDRTLLLSLRGVRREAW